MSHRLTVTLLAALACALPYCLGAGAAVARPAQAAQARTAAPAAPRARPAAAAQPATITPRMLVQPGALAGPGPTDLSWSPKGALLAYTGPADASDPDSATVLWLYDADAKSRRVLLDPARAPGSIDVSSALWAPDGRTMLLAGTTSLWLLDVAAPRLTQLPARGRGAFDAMEFTPDGTRVSYTRGNDIYTTRLSDGRVHRLTRNGGQDMFNGCLDFVYNEELATRSNQPGYAWSPDGRHLMYMRLDDRRVDNDPVIDYEPIPATVAYTRYPAAGTTNPRVTLHYLPPFAGANIRHVPLPRDAEYVLPFYAWTNDSSEVLYTTVDRDHTVLRLMAYHPGRTRSRTLIVETSPTFIDEDFCAAPVMLPDGEHFLWISERDGWMHLYLYSLRTGLERKLTDGDWTIESTPYGLLTAGRPVYVDPAGRWAYFNATKQSPLERQAYRVEIATGKLEQLTTAPGFHEPALSGDGRYLVDQWSATGTPPVTEVLTADGAPYDELARCAGPSVDLPAVTRESHTVKAADGTTLYAQLVKPQDFDPAKKYPVVVHWYGGPGLQMVADRYGTTGIFNTIERDTLYTQAGYLVWRLDNRGSYGRGHTFAAAIGDVLGPVALQDQLAGVEYLKTLPYVDARRIGSDGKSFGGYLTLYALLHAPETFRCGVDAAGVGSWAMYDTIYTERFMRTPAQNPDGYAQTDLIAAAAGIEAPPLIVHGTADTNVHLQNSIDFIAQLQAAGKPFVFVPLPGCNHSIRGDDLATLLDASVAYFAEEL